MVPRIAGALTTVIILVTILAPVPAFEVIGIQPPVHVGDAGHDHTELVGEMFANAIVGIPGLRVVELAEDRSVDYRLRVSVSRVQDETVVTTTVDNTTTGTIIHAALVTLTPDNANTAVVSWREELEIALELQARERLVQQIAYLDQENNASLAWEYIQRAAIIAVPVDRDLEARIRTMQTAAALDTAEGSEELVDVTLMAADSEAVEPLVQRRQAARALSETARAEARSDRVAARRTAAADEFHSQRTAARRASRAGDPRAAEQYLSTAASVETDNSLQGVRDVTSLRRELVRWETERRSSEEREIRRANLPDPWAPETVRRRSLWVSIAGNTIQDPLQRYRLNGITPAATVAFRDTTPVVSYVQLQRSAALSISQPDALTRIDATAEAALAPGTTLLEGAVGPILGVSLLTGTVGDREITRAGPTGGVVLAGYLSIPGTSVRLGVRSQWTRTLWIPTWYVSRETRIGFTTGWQW